MQIVRGLESFPPDAGPSAVALGAFDGIHLGHRAILGTAVTHARSGKLRALACTFDRHPMEVPPPGSSGVTTRSAARWSGAPVGDGPSAFPRPTSEPTVLWGFRSGFTSAGSRSACASIRPS